MTYRSVSCNVHGPGSTANNKRTITTAAKYADVLKMQEGLEASTHAILRNLGTGWGKYLPKGLPSSNPIVWRNAVMAPFDDPGWKRIYVNKPSVKDGPDRSMTWVPLLEKKTQRQVIEVNVHMIHQAFTKHPERQPGWNSSIRVVGATCRQLLEKYKCSLVISGDWNKHTKIDIPGLLEKEIASPATFNRLRYDRFFLVACVGTDADDIPTPSDHDALRVRITLPAGDRIPPLTPTTPTPKPAPKPSTNRVEEWRKAIEAANKLPFPTKKDRPEAFEMREEVKRALAQGPKK